MAVSVVLHAALLALLLRPPDPRLLTPYSVALGRNGKSVTRLYWPSHVPDDSTGSSPDNATQRYRRQRLAHERLVWKRTSQLAKLTPPLPLAPTDSDDNSKASTISNLGHGAPAGLPYGTLAGGPAYGDEIRPALPLSTSDPVAFPWEMPQSEGNVVVEITIDERGEIVNKVVLQSMGSALDTKVLAALDNWHFHPATRNGAAIPSKQDAIFHFRARG